MKFVITFIICFSIAFSGCIGMEKTVVEVHSFEINGTMHYINEKGGCWQFIENNGITYELTGAKIVHLLQEGLRANLIVRGPLRLPTVCHTGIIVEILEIQRKSSK